MTLDPDACYRALVAKDDRFDGTFFVGVKTTGIYCRPVCRARTPRRDRCVFYAQAIEAERDGYRACFRCRPERAPRSGNAGRPANAIVAAALERIQAGALSEGSVERLARDVGVSARHLRRAMDAELGVSPLEVALSRRIALARQLLLDTSMSVTDVAFASGFQSVRRFNAAFAKSQGRTPSSMRRPSGEAAPLGLSLDFRPPFDWKGLLAFLAPRAIRGVEHVDGASYGRAIAIGGRSGWFTATLSTERPAVAIDVSPSLHAVLLPLLAKVRRMFDLDAHPARISEHLGRDPRLARLVRARPGLRIPAAWDPFEGLVRAILGQQISVKGATTLVGRVADAFGEPTETPFGARRIFPDAARLARAGADALKTIGLTSARARTLHEAATAVTERRVILDPGAPEKTIASLVALPGIGPWTANYVAMRALAWPDAFPDGDLGLLKATGEDATGLRERAERWRPWRAYAAMHLWNEEIDT